MCNIPTNETKKTIKNLASAALKLPDVVLGALLFGLITFLIRAVVSITDDCLPSCITNHNMSGSTLTVQMYTYNAINAEYCARDVMQDAHTIASECYPNISRLVVNYGIKYSNKYGEKKQADLGTFEPNLSTLRRL